jgi:NAD(P)H-dependent FMN reductase
MKIMAIYGNPKHDGFVHECLNLVAKRLEQNGAEIDRLKLADVDIRDCAGCFQCLRTGSCAIHDDMGQIIDRMRDADGFITGASVRNGYFPALYKRFYERICYILGFGRELRGKHVLSVGAVGMATGKKHLGKLLTLREFQTYVVAYLFFRTGIPTRLKADDVSDRLDVVADRFHASVLSRAGLSLWTRLETRIDDFLIRKFMLERNPDHVYDYIIEQWRKKGLI